MKDLIEQVWNYAEKERSQIHEQLLATRMLRVKEKSLCIGCGLVLGTKRRPFLVNMGGYKLPTCLKCTSLGMIDEWGGYDGRIDE